jgi:hypothetical protein
VVAFASAVSSSHVVGMSVIPALASRSLFTAITNGRLANGIPICFDALGPEMPNDAGSNWSLPPTASHSFVPISTKAPVA